MMQYKDVVLITAHGNFAAQNCTFVFACVNSRSSHGVANTRLQWGNNEFQLPPFANTFILEGEKYLSVSKILEYLPEKKKLFQVKIVIY